MTTVRKTVAFTTTIPQEVIWAAGAVPVDLNNLFITGNSADYIRRAEALGIPRATCSWIKGIMGVVDAIRPDMVIAVTEGDCSNNHALMSQFRYHYPDMKILGFAYPQDKDPQMLELQLSKLMDHLKVAPIEVDRVKQKLDGLRHKLFTVDHLQTEHVGMSGKALQQLLVSSTDFNQNLETYETDVDQWITLLSSAPLDAGTVRLGISGVPSILSDLSDLIETRFPARIVYYEVESDFAMMEPSPTLVSQYLHFRYPYELFARIAVMNQQIKERGIVAMIHYIQSFCHRQIEASLIQKLLDVPVLVLEGDAPGPVDMRTQIRIEQFMERITGATL